MMSAKNLLLVILLLTLTHVSFSQRGKDGDLTVATANNILNTYTYLTNDASVGATSITVNNNAMSGGAFGGNLAPGDLIMIIQMQGAVANIDAQGVINYGGDYTVPHPHFWNFDWGDHIEEFGNLDPAFGGAGYYNSGKYEQVEVLSITGVNTINLQCALVNNYTAAGHVQIIRVPRFNNLTVSGGLSAIIPTLWNGQTGGVVALEVEQVLDLNAGSSISASGFGFRGGAVDPLPSLIGGTVPPIETRYVGTWKHEEGSEKGESIMGHYAEMDAMFSRWGIGAITNGGGGGGYQNCGGGGGSNVYMGPDAYTSNGIPDPFYTATWGLDFSHPPYPGPGPLAGTSSSGGGRGGYALAGIDQNELVVGPQNASWGADARKINGGRGGHPLTYDATRLFFGGGGGAGDDDSGDGGAGGRGGGIVYITSFGSIIGGGTIEANGAAGQNSNPTNGGGTRRGNDGAGGGGAGGSIKIENAAVLPGGSFSLDAIGGDGGNQNLQYSLPTSFSCEAGGPGGSGTGGNIAFNLAAPTQNVNAGISGICITNHPTPMMNNFPVNGATDGAVGVPSLPSNYFDLTAMDVTICSGDIANLSVSVLGSFPAGTNASDLTWYTAYSGNSLAPLNPGNTGLTYTTLPLFATTTFYVGLCPSTFRIPITVTVNPAPTISGNGALCVGGTLNLTGSGTPDATTPWASSTPGVATIDNTGLVTGISAGSTTITYMDDIGCTNTELVTVTLSDDASFTTTPTCDGGTSSVPGTPGGVFSFNTPPGDAAVINPATGTVSGGTPGATYDILYTSPAGPCQATNTEMVTALLADDATFTMTPTCDGGTASVPGTPGGVFSFNTPPGDAAVINPANGTITGGTTGNTYDVLYTSPAGPCQASSTQMVTAATDLAYTVVITDENCGAGDGILDFTASGGDGGPYQYSITGGAPYQGSGTFGSLSAATFNVSILDNSGCEITSTETVSSTGGPTIDAITPTDPSCAGACDGTITVTVSGGTPPYSYQWYDNLSNPIGTDSPSLGPICAGDYSVEVTDASGGAVYYFDENFGTDGVACSSQGTVAAGYNSGVGAWTVTATGINDPEANIWYVSTMEAGVGGTGPGFCSDGCGLTPGLTDRTLHISNVDLPPLLVADQGAAYFNGGACALAPFFWCIDADTRAESPAINLAGTNMTLSFDYIHEGNGADQCEVWYYDGGAWNNLGVLPNTNVGGCGLSQHEWANYSWPIPAPLNGTANFQIAFRWYNNDDAVGNDPSVAIDNIQVFEPSSACPAIANTTLTDPAAPVLIVTDPVAVCAPGTVDITVPAVTVGSDVGTLSYWNDAGATSPLAGANAIAIAGTYYIQLDVSGCTVTQPVVVTIDPQPTISGNAPICIGATVQLTGSGTPDGVTPWTSSTPGVATVDNTGLVTGVSAGTTTITYLDDNGCSNTELVAVNPTPTISGNTPICIGATVQLTGSGTPDGATPWTSSAPGVATVDNTGLVSAVSAGTTTITYLDNNGCSNTEIVTVNPTPTISGNAPICIGATVQLTGSGTPDGATPWSSSAPGVATVDNTGLVTGVSAGTSTITYLDDNGCSNTELVTVNPTPTISGNAPICIGATVQLTGSGTPDGVTPWSSSAPGVATVDNTGLVTGVSAGTTTITYLDDNGCSNTEIITVNPNPAITTTPTPLTGCNSNDGIITVSDIGGATGDVTWTGTASGSAIGVTLPYDITGLAAGTYDVTFTDGTTGCTSTVSQETFINPGAPVIDPIADYSSCNIDFTLLDANIMGSGLSGSQAYYTATGGPSGAGVLIPDGTVYTAPTTITIYAYDENGACSSEEVFTVTVNPTPTISGNAPICIGATVQLTGSGTPDGATPWSSSAPGVATVDNTGLVTGVSAGTTTITYLDDNGCSNTELVTVNPTPTISGNAPICIGATVQLTGSGTPDGVTPWSSSAPGVATVDNTGLVTGVSAGTTTITYLDDNGCSNTEIITVNPNPAITTTPTPLTGCNSNDGIITVSDIGGATGDVTWTGTASGSAIGVTLPYDITGLAAGTYDVTFTDGTTGCTSTVSQETFINPGAPVIDPIADYSSCNVDFTLLDANITGTGLTGSQAYYTATGGPSGAGVLIPDGTVYTAPTTITIYAYDENGVCSSEESFVVTVNAIPTISGTTSVCVGSTVQLTGSGTPDGVTPWSSSMAGLASVDNTGLVTGVSAGTPTITYTDANGCQQTQLITVNSIDDASFTMTPQCSGATVTTVVTAGGSYTFNPAPGDGALVNSFTGEITNGVAGSTYTVEYTTNGTCPSVSTFDVTLLSPEDATFTMTPSCTGAIVSSVNTPGGSFTFNPAPGDGAVVDSFTGEITNGISGTTYTVVYTTNGSCPGSLSVDVTLLSPDDASFQMIPTCDGGDTAQVVTPGGTFVFNPIPTDGAVIDMLTGSISNGIPGTTYTVEYNTGSACPGVLAVNITLLNLDDPSFTMTPTCDGGTANITGLPGGTFSFDIAPTDGAVINAASGTITGGVSGTTYQVMYTTSGACPDNSVESVVADDCPTFTIPTAFTPDGDTDNDDWEILELDNLYPNSIVRIYNRWGNLIFEHASSASSPYDLNRWDGTYKGKLLPVASYFFIIDFNDGIMEPETGTVSIILN